MDGWMDGWGFPATIIPSRDENCDLSLLWYSLYFLWLFLVPFRQAALGERKHLGRQGNRSSTVATHSRET